MRTLWQDLRYGFRTLTRKPGFTVVAIIALALGIGANTAIFSVVNSVLLRPLAYREPAALVVINHDYPKINLKASVSAIGYTHYRDNARSFESVAAMTGGGFNLTGGGDPEQVNGSRITYNFFSALGAEAGLGRVFLPEEDQPGKNKVVVLSHGFWQRRFGGDPGIVNKNITLNDESYTVVGVMPPSFQFGRELGQVVDLWTPIAFTPQQLSYNNLTNENLFVFARLKRGVTIGQAQAELDTIAANLRRQYLPWAGSRSEWGLTTESLTELVIGNIRQALWILMGIVGLVLLIACANVANLQLSRAAGRQREFAVRAALGARSWRLMRQMLTESWLLALGGGALGLLLAFLLTKAFVAMTPTDMFGDIARLSPINLDLSALGFTSIVSLLTGTLFGLAPAFQFSRPNPPNLNDSLKEGGRGHSFQRTRLRQLLMVMEVALAVVLLAGAGLLMRSFVKLLEVNPGYRPDNLLTAQVSPPALGSQEGGRRNSFYREILQRVSALPGVESAGVISHLPLTDFQLQGWLRLPGRQQFLNLDQPAIPIGIVSEDYFRTMGIPLRAGRIFTERDHSEAQRVVILSESLARSLYPNEDAVGKQVWMPGPGEDMSTVIGIVGDVRHQGLERDATPQIYVPYMQSELWSAAIVIRTTSDPLRLAAAVRNQALAVDTGAAVYDLQTMERRLATSMSSRRFNLLLLSIFGLLALTLAAVGVFSVIAHAVTQRTYEIGIRMALGASRGNILRLFVGQGMTFVAIGIALGLAGAWALTRVMATLLFGVSATDPLTFAGVAFLLSIVALLACYLPARRAAKVDPMTSLRFE